MQHDPREAVTIQDLHREMADPCLSIPGSQSLPVALRCVLCLLAVCLQALEHWMARLSSQLLMYHAWFPKEIAVCPSYDWNG